MKKEITINEIIGISNTLESIANAGLTGKIAYLAYRNLSKTAKIVDAYNRSREELVKKYGEEDPEVKDQIIVRRESEGYPKFVEELTEVLNQTEEVELYMISEKDLEKLADANLSVADFAIIDNYLVNRPEEEEEEETPTDEAE